MKQTLDPQAIEWYPKIGQQLRKLRKEQTGLSYIDFAKMVGMNRKTYYKIETGAGEFYFSSLIRVLSYYKDLPLSQFLRDLEL